MEIANRLLDFSEKVQKYSVIRAIRDGLVSMIPVLIIGAFALILKSFPIPGYIDFITTFGNGFINNFFNFIYSATFGVLSVYMTISISRAFMKIKDDSIIVHFGAILASVLVFFMLSGSFNEGFKLDNMGPKSMLIALISGLGASALYMFFYRLMAKRPKRILSLGADSGFNRMLSTLFPVLFVSLCFAIVNLFIIEVFRVDSFRDFYIMILNKLFSIGDNGFIKGFFFVFLSSVLWFFGVHGSDALEGVMQTYFVPGLQANIDAGSAANTVLTKEFFDCFVLMGGCGSAICLLIAILAFSRNKARRGLGITASVPMIFNINELMVFGLPIIFNPIMLIPFLLVPLVCYTVAYIAISTGMVPYITSQVEWTTPIILGGYRATGSIAGSFLQLFNVALGVAIYLPFVKILDRQSEKTVKKNYDEFMTYFLENEANLQSTKLYELNNIYGSFAKELTADIKHDLAKNITMFYQPLYNYEDKCVAVEALLRWTHPILGQLYPPLVMKLASDAGFVTDLEEQIIKEVVNSKDKIYRKFGEGIKISINATGSSFASGKLLTILKDINKETPFKGANICIELTEQEAFSINDETREYLNECKEMGLQLAIDDFSMGQTTLHYLKENLFNVIKIDGSLVKGLTNSQNCREIVSSLIELADSLSLTVVAEYVETEEERDILHEMGCNCYQGYLFSPAVPLVEE